jgi:hypothetical protein
VKDDRRPSGGGPRDSGSRNQGDAGFSDEALRGRFAALRGEDERGSPGFAGLWQMRARMPRRRNYWLATAVCAVVILAGLFLLRSMQRVPEVNTMASITEWKAPTDFLLETPGRELLRTVPRVGESNLGGLSGYTAPLPPARPSPARK